METLRVTATPYSDEECWLEVDKVDLGPEAEQNLDT